MKRNLFFNQATAIGKRLAMVLTMLLIVGIGQAWGESIEINTTNSGVNGSYRDYEFDVSSITFGCTQWMKNTNIQAKKSTTNSFYNVDAIPGTITSVVVKQTGTARAIKIYGGTSSKPTTQITSPNTAAEMTFDFTGKNYTYFSLTTPGNACYFDKITINYTPSGGGNTGDDNTGGESDCDVWKLITDASDLKVGDEIVIAAANADVAMSKNANTNKNENRAAEEITKSGNTIIINSFVQTITLENGTKNETFAFNTGNSYLYAASSSANHLKTKNTLDDNGSWSISITSEGIATIKAQGSNTRNWLRYNGQSSLFSCYASDQADVSIYKYVECGSTEPTVFVIPKCGGMVAARG